MKNGQTTDDGSAFNSGLLEALGLSPDTETDADDGGIELTGDEAPEAEADDADANREANDAQDIVSDSSISDEEKIARIKARYNGDSEAMARDLLGLQRTTARHGEERKKWEQQQQQQRTTESSDNSSGQQQQAKLPVDELGVEYIPDELWESAEYFERVCAALRSKGVPEASLEARAFYEIAALRTREERKYAEKRVSAMMQTRDSRPALEQARDEFAAQEAETITSVYADAYGADGADNIKKAVLFVAGTLIEKAVESGNITAQDAMRNEIVSSAIDQAHGLLARKGKIAEVGRAKPTASPVPGEATGGATVSSQQESYGGRREVTGTRDAMQSAKVSVTDANLGAYMGRLTPDEKVSLEAMRSASLHGSDRERVEAIIKGRAIK